MDEREENKDSLPLVWWCSLGIHGNRLMCASPQFKAVFLCALFLFLLLQSWNRTNSDFVIVIKSQMLVQYKSKLSDNWVIQQWKENYWKSICWAYPGKAWEMFRDTKGGMLYVGGWSQRQGSFIPMQRFCYSSIQKLKYTLESWVRKYPKTPCTRFLILEWHNLMYQL